MENIWVLHQKLALIDYLRLHQNYKTRKNTMTVGPIRDMSPAFRFHMNCPFYQTDQPDCFFWQEQFYSRSGLWP